MVQTTSQCGKVSFHFPPPCLGKENNKNNGRKKLVWRDANTVWHHQKKIKKIKNPPITFNDTPRLFRKALYTHSLWLLLRWHQTTSVRQDKVDADKKDCFDVVFWKLLSGDIVRPSQEKINKKSVVQKCALKAISQSKHLMSLDDEYHDLGVFSTSRKSWQFRNRLRREWMKWCRCCSNILK